MGKLYWESSYGLSGELTCLGDFLKCLCSNTHSMAIKGKN